ncbi:mitochondrial carrier domain-containing protein [Kickxella alabastrina]|uniref:mitochondrial carrier domain-containing protein n=1 Tax=Kickxella alabastrina TaxID=61397 RepID=UPI0022202780|nr:mitochondrial carrier domain-containing protein [Kickxella alabastrina]KAI7829060.1 mitochondrial carrier domain-containing protein [Kickxella alabastrina]
MEQHCPGCSHPTFEVSTLGQPFEVVKTHMAANRADSIATTLKKTYARGGISGFYQGLIPWAWIEASTKGGVLMFTSSEIDYRARLGGLFGGVGGGVAQAYTTMGFCTFMKTVEVTRHNTWKIAYDVFQREGIRGLNRGVSAVALRQMTNWGSRFGIARVTESVFRGKDTNRKLTNTERLASSAIGGALACWNHPSRSFASKCKQWSDGFYRGVTPRIGLSVYLTVCMVFGGDSVKAYFNESQKKKAASVHA